MIIESNRLDTETAHFLFNQNRYLQANSLTALTFADKASSPTCFINMIEALPKMYISGLRAPFAGIECSDTNALDTLVKELVETYRKRGDGEIFIKQAPVFYHTAVAADIDAALRSNGFKLLHTDVNQYLPVDAAKSFIGSIDYQKRRSLRILKQKGAQAVFFNAIESDIWYALYLKSRKYKNYPVTISKEQYDLLSIKLPDAYWYVGVFLDGKLIANAVWVQVTKDIVYYFLAASDPDYDVFSPSIMLIEALYDRACAEGIKIIDLGVSSIEGVLNEGLHFFKRNVGGIDSQKNTYGLLC
jgi:hypothetical protein